MSETNAFEELIVMRSKGGDGTIYRQRQLVRCKDCCHWKPPHIKLNDGKQRAYKKGDKEDPFGLGVSADVGLNVGGMCWVDHNCGYGRDMRVHRSKDDFCSRADKLSEEPTELRDDFDY